MPFMEAKRGSHLWRGGGGAFAEGFLDEHGILRSSASYGSVKRTPHQTDFSRGQSEIGMLKKTMKEIMLLANSLKVLPQLRLTECVNRMI